MAKTSQDRGASFVVAVIGALGAVQLVYPFLPLPVAAAIAGVYALNAMKNFVDVFKD